LSDVQLEELRRILIAFSFQLLDKHLEKIGNKKGLSLEQTNEASQEHSRKSHSCSKTGSREKS